MSNRRGQRGYRAQLLGVTDNKLETWRIDGYTASCRRGWQGQAVSPPQSKAQARRFTTSRSANLGFCGDGSGWVGRSAYHGWPQPCTLWPWKPPAEGRVAEGVVMDMAPLITLLLQVSRKPLPPLCSLPVDKGQCQTMVLRWYYNTKSGRCERFGYGGCGGNENNFLNRNICRLTCRRS